jgi:hypothetical protein
MGQAGSALMNEAESLSINPAGLALISGGNVSFGHNAWVQDTALEHFAVGIPLGAGQGLAAGLSYMNFGAVDKYKVENGLPQKDGSFTPTGLKADLGWGMGVGRGFSLGASVKYLGQTMDTSASGAMAGDIGALWKPSASGWSLGMAMQNLGGQLDGSDLPRNLKAGAAYSLGNAGNDISLAADVNYPFADSKAVSVGVGGEYWYQKMAAFRLGYLAQDRGSLAGTSGLSLGLGAAYRWVKLDYSFTALGDLGNTNQVTLSATF